MSERSKLISKLCADREFRTDYIRAKLEVLIPSQLRALRLRQEITQPILASEAGMKQSRISAMETPGRVNFNLETLVRMAATFKVGLVVKFVPFSEMLRWENQHSQDDFGAIQIDRDAEFLEPNVSTIRNSLAAASSSIGNYAADEAIRSITEAATQKSNPIASIGIGQSSQLQRAAGGIR